MNGNEFLALLILALPVACASWTIAMTEIFRFPREAIKAWAKKRPDSKFRHLVSYLPTCYYCTSHYVAEFFLVSAYVAGMKKLDFTYGWTSAVVGFIIATFTLVWVANLYLTGFNIYRVLLRYVQSLADYQEAVKDRARAQADLAEQELAERLMAEEETTTSVAA